MVPPAIRDMYAYFRCRINSRTSEVETGTIRTAAEEDQAAAEARRRKEEEERAEREREEREREEERLRKKENSRWNKFKRSIRKFADDITKDE